MIIVCRRIRAYKSVNSLNFCCREYKVKNVTYSCLMTYWSLQSPGKYVYTSHHCFFFWWPSSIMIQFVDFPLTVIIYTLTTVWTEICFWIYHFRGAGNFKLKEKIRVAELWFSHCLEVVCEVAKNSDTSFVLGWPTTNVVATFW